MRFDTQDLLTLRDGEPIDAERRARVLADIDQVREIDRLEQVQRELRGLPELAPPNEAWQRIAAALERPASRPRRTWSRVAAIAVGAAVLVAFAAAMIADRADEPSQPLSLVHVESAPNLDSPANVEASRALPVGMDAHSTLVAESARLERVLAQIGFQPEVMSAGTAGTIAGLEDTLAALDEQLTFAAAGGLEPHERETLWRERVNVMRALVQVRYAQAQRSGL
jgi:hypothetical protein